MPEIQRVAVLGAGTMGSGIAQACAQAHLLVNLADVGEDLVRQNVQERIVKPLDGRVAKGRMTAAERDAVVGRITPLGDVRKAVADADLVIEAVFEEQKVKEETYAAIADALPASAIVATNTSSLSVTELAPATGRPDRFGGLHFFNPAAVNLLLEVVPGLWTSADTLRTLRSFGRTLGKTAIVVKDSPGFCVNRFFVPLLNEACRLLDEGVADVPTIDHAAKEALGITMGPFELMNFTGIPVGFHAQETLHRNLGAFYAPSRVLAEQFEKGAPFALQGAPDPSASAAVQDRLLGVVFGIACHLVDEGVSTFQDADLGAVVGLRWKAGPFALMNRAGIAKSLEHVRRVHETWGDRFPLPRALVQQAARCQPFHIPKVRKEVRDGIATLSIVRPEALNALNPEVLKDLDRALASLGQDATLRAVILTGEGRAFVAGADIGVMAEVSALESRDFTLHGQAVMERIATFPVPVIAAVNGYALGGGTELAISCDIVLASEDAVFGLPEVGLGIHPGFGGTQRLPRLVGPQRAKELTLTGRHVDGEEAAAIGLALKVVPAAKLLDEAMALAAAIAKNAPVAVRLAKRAIDLASDVDLATGIKYEAESVTLTFATEDRVEGMKAFLEKRKPSFEGK